MTAREPSESLADFLYRLRVAVGEREDHHRGRISQQEAADRAGVTREQWNRWEHGQQMEPHNAAKVARAFSLNQQDLLRREAAGLEALSVRFDARFDDLQDELRGRDGRLERTLSQLRDQIAQLAAARTTEERR